MADVLVTLAVGLAVLIGIVLGVRHKRRIRRSDRSVGEWLSLTVRKPIEVMNVVAAFFAEQPDTEITFEGDTSMIDWATIQGATVRSVQADRKLAVVPLTVANSELLKRSVFPRIGLRSRIAHIIVRRRGQDLFASYDWFWKNLVGIKGPHQDRLLSALQAAGLVIAHNVGGSTADAARSAN